MGILTPSAERDATFRFASGASTPKDWAALYCTDPGGRRDRSNVRRSRWGAPTVRPRRRGCLEPGRDDMRCWQAAHHDDVLRDQRHRDLPAVPQPDPGGVEPRQVTVPL